MPSAPDTPPEYPPDYATYHAPDYGNGTAEALKLPPHSIDAEQSVLGGLMLDNSAWDRVADAVSEVDFYRYDHRLLFRGISRLADENSPFDAITLSDWLVNQGLIHEVGGIGYLSELASNSLGAANIKSYAAIVRERSILRQLIQATNEIADSAYQPEGRKVSEILDIAETKIFSIAEQSARSRVGFVAIRDLLNDAVDRIEDLFERDSPITGIPTDFTDFDMKTSGLQNSDLIIIAGRPSMGKTSFAMNIAENAAIKYQHPVAIFSMEMPGVQIAMRMISSLGRINQTRLRSGKLDDDDWSRITSALGMLSESPIYIDDTPALTHTELRARARRLKRDKGLGLIIIDYLQLMRGSGSSAENRATEISEISRSLKALAKELNVPVIALSQLNRSLEQRPNKRPVMSDLRESGAIEQDADVITFIYRDEVYNEDSHDKGVAEIILGKQRNGPIGMVRLAFLGEYTRFENLAHDSYGNDFG
ncbi:MAG: replicative DNA helicase [Gammaproteobacteria bacterium]|nr:replicative DNA helicase [Gammaproteobacteria bacterium]